MIAHGRGMTKLAKWLRASFRRPGAEVASVDFTEIHAMLEMLQDETGITPGHP